jgi:hypothetical protein
MSLVNNIRSLNSDQIKGIINIIHDNLNVDEKTMEFDINNLPMEKLKELDKYVKKCLKIKKKNNDLANSQNFERINSGMPQTAPVRTSDNNINVNININNNFMMGTFKTQNNFTSNVKLNEENLNIIKNRSSILSDSESLSSDEDSGKENYFII